MLHRRNSTDESKWNAQRLSFVLTRLSTNSSICVNIFTLSNFKFIFISIFCSIYFFSFFVFFLWFDRSLVTLNTQMLEIVQLVISHVILLSVNWFMIYLSINNMNEDQNEFWQSKDFQMKRNWIESCAFSFPHIVSPKQFCIYRFIWSIGSKIKQWIQSTMCIQRMSYMNIVNTECGDRYSLHFVQKYVIVIVRHTHFTYS